VVIQLHRIGTLLLSVMFLLSSSGMAAAPADSHILHNLDLNRVQFVVDASPALTARFEDRTIMLFAKAGLSLPRQTQRRSQPVATLKLALNPSTIGEACPGHVRYEPSLALIEPVMTPRNREVLHDITWSSWAGPHIRIPVTIEELEADLDGFVERFMVSYKLANPEWHEQKPSSDPKKPENQDTAQNSLEPIFSVAPNNNPAISVNDLNLTPLQLTVSAGKLSAPLSTRVRQQLTAAGIPVSPDSTRDEAPTLSLELNQMSVERQCPGRILYESGLYLVEQVRIERNPKVLIWSDTWTRYRLWIIPPVSQEWIESDQDSLLKQFINSIPTK
jgi:hypothetical protein